jgi:1-aminocyclopropane-1-carboxylate deaminase/D-cysteine desulfhydrase-like pyridoxal-dependent ACC family enzyme
MRGPAYGVPHEATIEAIRLAGQFEALPLDPVYSGKGLAGLIALIRQGRWRNDEDVIFLHRRRAGAIRLPERARHLSGRRQSRQRMGGFRYAFC